MKIAIEARPVKWSYGTGIGNYTYCLIEKLNEIDTENEYTFLWPDEDPLPHIPYKKSYTYYTLPKDDEREEIEIPLWLAAEKVDLFHLPQNGFRTPKLSSGKLLVTIHDLIPYFLPEVVRPSFLKRFTREMPDIVERADHILTVSQLSKKDIGAIFGIPASKISVVYSAPAKNYRPLPANEVQNRLAEKYGLKTPYILYAGGLNPRKNVPELIYAYSKVHRDLPRLQKLVVLGGEGSHLSRLKYLVEALNLNGEIIFPGFVDSTDLPFFYNGADLFVYPSLYEGFGLPPIEAMACGTPVITSNVSSIPEIVGEAALQVNPNDTLELAENIFTVLENRALREALIQKGLQHSKLFTWEKSAAQILDIYRSIVNGKPVSTAAEQ
ncbi:MAG: glycosyltransferase family 4 protein [Bacillota bacterium]